MQCTFFIISASYRHISVATIKGTVINEVECVGLKHLNYIMRQVSNKENIQESIPSPRCFEHVSCIGHCEGNECASL